MVEQNKSAPAAAHAQTPPRILIVEESDINRRLATHMFGEAGCLVESVTNGHDALRAVKHTSYDLVVMDCRLSDFPQFMATRMIRLWEIRHHPGGRVPVIGLTAFAPPGFTERCRRAGMDACFEKPIRHEVVQKIKRRWLAGSARVRVMRAAPITALRASGDRPPRPGAFPPGPAGTYPA